MRTRLLVLGCFAHDPQRILTAVYGVALVGIKRSADFVLRLILGGFAGFELSIAAFADADGRGVSLYESEFALLHDCSLAHRAGMA